VGRWIATIGALLIVLLARSAAASVIVVDDAFASRAIGGDVELLVDPSAKMSVNDVLASPDWVASEKPTPNFGFTHAAVWARFVVRDTRKDTSPLRLELAYAPLDRIEVHAIRAGPTQLGGDTFPFAERSYPYRFVTFPLASSPERVTTYLVRLSGESSLQLALSVYSPSAFSAHVTRDLVIQGAWIGIVGALAIYNLFLFFAVGTRAYLFYSLFTGSILIYQSTIDGLTFQFLWPNGTWLANHAIPFFVGSACAFAFAFAQSFLGTEKHTPRLHRGATIAMWTVASSAPVSLVIPPMIGLRICSILAALSCLFLIAIGAVRVKQGDRSARFYLIAWSLFLTGAILTAMRVAGRVPTTLFTTYAQQVGSAVEVLLLSIALADRIHTLRSEAATSATELERLNQELRRQIADRSRALADALAAVASPRASGLSPGELFDQRYRILRALGHGGMGTVVEVERLEDHKRFALKVMSGRHTPAASARFAREAEIAARVEHANLVGIVDVGVSQEGLLYLVLELIEGSTLEALRERFGDVAWGIRLLRQVAEGLDALHSQGIVHRDLKPGNVMLTADGLAKIGDFGIARFDEPREKPDAEAATMADERISGTRPQGLTETGVWLGTPAYMAPELVLGGRIARPASDVFSFGIIAYEVLTGAPPFASPAIYDILACRTLPEISAPAGVDPALGALLRDCLREDGNRRPTARALADALAGVRVTAA
jgi:hypothetical protein